MRDRVRVRLRCAGVAGGGRVQVCSRVSVKVLPNLNPNSDRNHRVCDRGSPPNRGV